MVDDKIKVCARIPSNIYDICLQRYDNITNAINAGLELLCRQECPTKRVDNIERLEEHIKENPIVDILNARLVEKDNELQAYQQSRIDDLKDENRKLQENHTNQVNLFVEQIKELKEDHRNEINRLADQMKEKDSQIKSLTTITESQVNHRPMKMIEAPGAKKWWKFW
jgi:predicted phage tail protein